MGCGVFKRGVQNYKDFCLRINILKGNYWILRIGLMGKCQKLGIILEKNVILIFFNEKKIEKDSDNF